MNSALKDGRDLNVRGKENSELSQNFEKKHNIKVRDVLVAVSEVPLCSEPTSSLGGRGTVGALSAWPVIVPGVQ